MRPVLHVLTGCTAVGKTEWALRWAEANGAEIISCDSLLFYRGMDIGTAKPTFSELVRVPHHLIDVLEVYEPADVTFYVGAVKRAVAEILARGKLVLIAGGSGFYLKCFFSAVADEVVVSPEIRAAVRAMDLSVALAQLRSLNADGLGALDVANPRRVQRALERCLASGKTIAALAQEFAAQPAPFADYEVKLTQLERPPLELDERVAARVAQMLAAGLVAEVQRLLPLGLRENPSASRAIGYREVIAHLDGLLPMRELASEITKNTRALVRKQRTWFRTQLPAHHVVSAEAVTVRELFAG